MDASDDALVLNENLDSDADDMDSDLDFVATDASEVPSDVESEDSIGDFVGLSDDEGMPIVNNVTSFVDNSSNTNVNSSVNNSVIAESEEAIFNEHDDVVHNSISINGERY